MRGFGIVTVLGALLIAAGTAVHPIFFDPWRPAAGLAHVAASRHWMAIHWVLLAGFGLWSVGLVGNHFLPTTRRESEPTPGHGAEGKPGDGAAGAIATVFALAAVPLWLASLILELAAALPAARVHVAAAATLLAALAGTVWTTGLLLGYVAILLQWLAVAGWSVTYMKTAHPSLRALGWGGIVAGLLGAAGTVAALALPRRQLTILALTSVWPAAWTIWYAWVAWVSSVRPPPAPVQSSPRSGQESDGRG